MPILSLGTWKIWPAQAATAVEEAIKIGYRGLDCAADYGNEKEVGKGIAAAIEAGVCKREDLFITSKLWNTYHRKENVRTACERTLSDLGLKYLDLYLIHFPISLRFIPFEHRYPPGWSVDPDAIPEVAELDNVSIIETWRAMEELVEAGLVKNIGVSNFNCALLMDLVKQSKIPIAANQVEIHPNLRQDRLLKFCNENNIVITAYSCLGSGSYVDLGMADPTESILENPKIKDIAVELKKTPAQVVLRWHVQRGVTLVPKSSKAERLQENFNIFDFELKPEHIEVFNSLPDGKRYNDPGVYMGTQFGVFYPIFD